MKCPILLKARFLIPIQLTNGRKNGCPKYFDIRTNNKCPFKKKGPMWILDPILHQTIVKGKVKCILVQALRHRTGRAAHTGSRGIALLFHDHGTRRG